MFENYEMAGVYIAIQAVLTLYAQGTVSYCKLNFTDICKCFFYSFAVLSARLPYWMHCLYRETALYISCSKLTCNYIAKTANTSSSKYLPCSCLMFNVVPTPVAV